MLVALMLLHIYTLLSIMFYQTIFFFLLLLFCFEFFLVEFEHMCFLPALVENKINEVSSVTSFPCEGSLYCGGGGSVGAGSGQQLGVTTGVTSVMILPGQF